MPRSPTIRSGEISIYGFQVRAVDALAITRVGRFITLVSHAESKRAVFVDGFDKRRSTLKTIARDAPIADQSRGT